MHFGEFSAAKKMLLQAQQLMPNDGKIQTLMKELDQKERLFKMDEKEMYQRMFKQFDKKREHSHKLNRLLFCQDEQLLYLPVFKKIVHGWSEWSCINRLYANASYWLYENTSSQIAKKKVNCVITIHEGYNTLHMIYLFALFIQIRYQFDFYTCRVRN